MNHSFIKEETFLQMVEIYSLEKEGNPYGFGWYLYGPKPNQNVVIGHSGEQTGTASQLLINRNRKTVVVVLSNTSGKWQEVIGTAVQLMKLFGKASDPEKG